MPGITADMVAPPIAGHRVDPTTVPTPDQLARERASRLERAVRQQARGIASAGTIVHPDGGVIDWSFDRHGLYRERYYPPATVTVITPR